MANINEFTIWTPEGVPVVQLASNLDFDLWQDGAPMVEVDEGQSEPVNVRRRVFIF